MLRYRKPGFDLGNNVIVNVSHITTSMVAVDSHLTILVICKTTAGGIC